MTSFPLVSRFAAAVSVIVAAAAAAAPHRVVIADDRGWSTTLVVGSSSDQMQTVVLTDCTVGLRPTAQLVPGGSAILADAGRSQCHLNGRFGLLTIDFDGVAESRLTFHNGGATVSSLGVPSLDVPLDAAHPQVRMRLVTNDVQSARGVRAFLVVFGPPADMTLYVYDGNDKLIDLESIHDFDFDFSRQMLFYPMVTQQPIGSIVLRPDQPDKTWYGFVSIGPADGTASEVRPWEAATPPHP